MTSVTAGGRRASPVAVQETTALRTAYIYGDAGNPVSKPV